ncbi:hypothetical protein FRC17_000727 [Serendipita sp. 399]|nr:hypothetical protein FRC17_000727 [Serendipita sp. 399]
MRDLWSFWFPRLHNSVEIYDDRLPPELWKIIIDAVIDEVRHPYRYCTPATFPQYRARFRLADKFDTNSALEDWKTVRSVCRTWRQLAGPRPHLSLRQYRTNMSKEEFSGGSSITIERSPPGELIMQNLVANPAHSHGVTTLIFTHARHHLVLDTVLDNPSSFPNLRCLSLVSTRSRRPFWEAIQDGYPRLVSLTIKQYSGDYSGYYRLPNVEILDLDSWGEFRLSCPSLKHFAIRHRRNDLVTEFIMEHGHQLESIILDTYGNLSVVGQPQKLWSLFPNIQTLGIQAKLSVSPPHGHPLRHLRLFPSFRSLEIEEVLTEVAKFPEITHVHIRPDELISGTMDELRARCLKRNVEVVEVPVAKPVSSSKFLPYMAWME